MKTKMLFQSQIRFQFPKKLLLQTALVFGFLSISIVQHGRVDGFLPKPGTFYWSPPRIRDVKADRVSAASTPLISSSKQSSLSKLETALASFNRLLKNTSVTWEYTKNSQPPVSKSADFSLSPSPLSKEGLNFLKPQSKTYSNRDVLSRHEFWDVLEVFTVQPSGAVKSGPRTKTPRSNRPRRFGNVRASTSRVKPHTQGDTNVQTSNEEKIFLQEINEQGRDQSKITLNSSTKPSRNIRKYYSFDSWRGKRSGPPFAFTTKFQTDKNGHEMNDRYKMTLTQKIRSDVEQSFNRLLRNFEITHAHSIAHSRELYLSQQQRTIPNRSSQNQEKTDRFEMSLNLEDRRQRTVDFPLLRQFVDDASFAKQFISAFKRGHLARKQNTQLREENRKDWPRGCCPPGFTSNSTRSKVYAKFKKILNEKIHGASLIGPDFKMEESELGGSESKSLFLKPGLSGKLKHSYSKENSHDGTSSLLDKMYDYLITFLPPNSSMSSPFRKLPDSLSHGRYKRTAVRPAEEPTVTSALKQRNIFENISQLKSPRRFNEWPIPLFKDLGGTNSTFPERAGQRQSEKGSAGLSKSRIRNLLSREGEHSTHDLLEDSSTRNLSNAGNLLNMISKINNSVETENGLIGNDDKQTENERSRTILLQSAQNLTNWRQTLLQFFFSEMKTRLNKLRVKQKDDRARYNGEYHGLKNQKSGATGNPLFSNYPHKPLFYDQFFKDTYHTVELVDEGLKTNKSSWLEMLGNGNRGYFHSFNKRENPSTLAAMLNSFKSPGPENMHTRTSNKSPFQISLSFIPGVNTGIKMNLSISKSRDISAGPPLTISRDKPRELPFPVHSYTTRSHLSDLSDTLFGSRYPRNLKRSKEKTEIRETDKTNTHQNAHADHTEFKIQNKIPKKTFHVSQHAHRDKRSTWKIATTTNSEEGKKNMSAQHKENSNSAKSPIQRGNSQRSVPNIKDSEVVTRSSPKPLITIKAKRPWWYSALYTPPATDNYRTTYLYLLGHRYRKQNTMKSEKRAQIAQAPESANVTNTLHKNGTAYSKFLFKLCRFILNKSTDDPEMERVHEMKSLEDVFRSLDILIAKYRQSQNESTNRDSYPAFGRVGNTASSRLDIKSLHRAKRYHQNDPLKTRKTHLVWSQIFHDLKNEKNVSEDFAPKIRHKIRFKYFAKNQTSSDFSLTSKALNQWQLAPDTLTSFPRMRNIKHKGKEEKTTEELSRSENTGLSLLLFEMKNKTKTQNEDINVMKRGAELREENAEIVPLQNSHTGPLAKQVVEGEDINLDRGQNGENNQKNGEVFDGGNTQLNHTSDCQNASVDEKRCGGASTNTAPAVAIVEKTGDTWVHRTQEDLLQRIFGKQSVTREVAAKESAAQHMLPCKTLMNTLTFVEPIGFSDFKD